MTNDMKNNKGNFAQNPERAREAGRKGGEHSQGTPADKDRARDAGVKGGQGRSDRM